MHTEHLELDELPNVARLRAVTVELPEDLDALARFLRKATALEVLGFDLQSNPLRDDAWPRFVEILTASRAREVGLGEYVSLRRDEQGRLSRISVTGDGPRPRSLVEHAAKAVGVVTHLEASRRTRAHLEPVLASLRAGA